MKPFKRFLVEAFNAKPPTKKELKQMLDDANMSDWYPFLLLVWSAIDNKDLMSFQFNKLAKGKSVSGQTLGLKIQPGEFYKMTMHPEAEKYRNKIFNKLRHKVTTSGSEPKLELSQTMKGDDGEMYDYSLDLIAGLGSGAKKGPDGAQWESIITDQVNTIRGNHGVDKAATETAEQFYPDYLPQAEALGQAFIDALGISSDMVQFGKGSASTSSIWKKRGASNTTPKTDMYTGNYNISLKKAGGSQLASGTAAETLSMFDAALELMSGSGGKVIKDIMKDIDEGFKTVSLDFNKGEMETMAGGGTAKGTSLKKGKLVKGEEELPKEKQAEFKKYTKTEEFHKQLNIKLENTFQKVTKNQEFVDWFCFEAMSGLKKFDAHELATASVCATFNPDKGTVTKINVTAGGKNKFGKSPKISPELQKKAAGVKIYAAWKSSGKNPYSVLRVSGDDHTRDKETYVDCTLQSLIRDEILLDEDIKNLGLNLTEEIVQLDEFALLKSVFKKMKNVGKDATKWLSGFFQRVFKQVTKVLNGIAELGSKMFEALFDFLGIEVDNVQTSVPSDVDHFFNK
ncbi:MAG: hypothetical protein HON34_04335 [Pelagibacteraceae bacterium]|nr:hypothetical protein [Pelagibacteraceae bacterium]